MIVKEIRGPEVTGWIREEEDRKSPLTIAGNFLVGEHTCSCGICSTQRCHPSLYPMLEKLRESSETLPCG